MKLKNEVNIKLLIHTSSSIETPKERHTLTGIRITKKLTAKPWEMVDEKSGEVSAGTKCEAPQCKVILDKPLELEDSKTKGKIMSPLPALLYLPPDTDYRADKHSSAIIYENVDFDNCLLEPITL